jgi:uncharacterized membrane protein YfcA
VSGDITIKPLRIKVSPVPIILLISGLFIAGGVAGGWIDARLASRVPKKWLTQIFAVIVQIVALYILYRNYAVVLHI